MNVILLALVALSGPPDGGRLTPSKACFTITAPVGGQDVPIGTTAQVVEPGELDGRPVWRVVVHQRLSSGKFDMRDAFVLDRRTLRPISLKTTMNGQPHAALTYGDDRVRGQAWDRAGKVREIDQAFEGPVWDGNLFGVTFAALPLALGRSFTVPFFQYDRGLGDFTLTVLGSQVVPTADGPTDAWVVDAGPSQTVRIEYLISKTKGLELGYHSPQGGQRLGGDCTGLD